MKESKIISINKSKVVNRIKLLEFKRFRLLKIAMRKTKADLTVRHFSIIEAQRNELRWVLKECTL